jgi:hypothetical protein
MKARPESSSYLLIYWSFTVDCYCRELAVFFVNGHKLFPVKCMEKMGAAIHSDVRVEERVVDQSTCVKPALVFRRVDGCETEEICNR